MVSRIYRIYRMCIYVYIIITAIRFGSISIPGRTGSSDSDSPVTPIPAISIQTIHAIPAIPVPAIHTIPVPLRFGDIRFQHPCDSARFASLDLNDSRRFDSHDSDDSCGSVQTIRTVCTIRANSRFGPVPIQRFRLSRFRFDSRPS